MQVDLPKGGRFVTNPSFVYERGSGNHYELTQELIYEASLNGGSFRVVVPIGFRTDFASVPRFFWRIFPPIGDWWRAAAMHDYLYEKTRVSKALADAMFWEGLLADQVGLWTRRLMYWAVRVFGGWSRGI